MRSRRPTQRAQQVCPRRLPQWGRGLVPWPAPARPPQPKAFYPNAFSTPSWCTMFALSDGVATRRGLASYFNTTRRSVFGSPAEVQRLDVGPVRLQLLVHSEVNRVKDETHPPIGSRPSSHKTAARLYQTPCSTAARPPGAGPPSGPLPRDCNLPENFVERRTSDPKLRQPRHAFRASSPDGQSNSPCTR